MTDDTAPGRGPGDLELTRRWRAQFDELPSGDVDARIRTAAHAEGDDAMRPRSQPGVSRSAQRWVRIAPLAAAASVALLAVGLVRLIPQEESVAIPVPAPAPAPGAGASVAAIAPTEATVAAETAAESRTSPGSSADVSAKSARVFVPDVPGAESSRSQEVTRAASAPGSLRGGDGVILGPTTGITTQAESHVSAARTAEAPATPPLSALLADAARRTGTEVDALRIVEVTRVTWRDASLGCGEANASESQDVSVPGFVVSVEGGGEILRYHTDADAQFRTCE